MSRIAVLNLANHWLLIIFLCTLPYSTGRAPAWIQGDRKGEPMTPIEEPNPRVLWGKNQAEDGNSGQDKELCGCHSGIGL